MIRKQPKAQVPRIWRMTGGVWLLVAAVCGFVELATFVATDGLITFWSTAIGLIAFFHWLRLVRAAG